MKINGLTVLAQAIRSSNQELVIVISNDLQTTNLLDIYAKRWKIECLFGQLKSYFRHGLDKLISIIQCNLQLALKIITTCLEPNIYMEKKCKKLICVMY